MIYNVSGQTLNTIYDISGNFITSAFDKEGNHVFGRPDYTSFTISDYLTISMSAMQGFDIANNVIYQLRGSSSISSTANTYNATTGVTLATGISIESNHGNTCSFSSAYYDEEDTLPLLYIANDVDRPSLRAPSSVSVNRVTNNSSTLIKTYLFVHPVTSYWGYACFDFANDIVYTVGLTGTSYTSDQSGTNKTIVTKWDISNPIDNGDGTYSATYISHYEREFIYVMQGLQYRDGIIWISSGYTSGSQMIYGMDAETGVIAYSINTNQTREIEGIAFLDDYHLVAGFANGYYKLLTFGEE